MILFIILIFVMISYTVTEKLLRHFSVIKGSVQLWSGVWYYLWGICLLASLLIIRPIDLVFRIPVNFDSVIGMIVIIILFLSISLKKGSNAYCPKSNELLKCIHFSIILPLFEETAFRGIILPILITLLNG